MRLTGIHRALGATRSQIFLLHLTECMVVGMTGGALGLGLSQVLLRVVNSWVPPRIYPADLFMLDLPMILVGLALAVIVSACAGIYPSWRASRTAPALQLKLG